MAPVPPPPYQVPQQPKKSNTALIIIIVGIFGFCFVIAILAAILFPVFSQAKLAAKRSESMRQASHIAQWLMVYASDNDGYMPHNFQTEEDLHFAVVIYANGPGDMFYSFNPNAGVFLPNGELEGISLDRVISPESAVLIFESAPWDGSNGRIAAFVNGRVEYVKPFSEPQMLPTRLMKEEEAP